MIGGHAVIEIKETAFAAASSIALSDRTMSRRRRFRSWLLSSMLEFIMGSDLVTGSKDRTRSANGQTRSTFE